MDIAGTGDRFEIEPPERLTGIKELRTKLRARGISSRIIDRIENDIETLPRKNQIPRIPSHIHRAPKWRPKRLFRWH